MMQTTIRLIIVLVVMTSTVWAQDSADTGSILSKKEAQEVVDYHNKVRKEVGCPSLEWSNELAAFAQEWANEIARGGNCFALKHRPRSGKWASSYGENCAGAFKGQNPHISGCELWYKEKKFFKGRKFTMALFSKTGHYTQMIWRTTTKVGLGMAFCGDKVVVVANYDPPGNYMNANVY